MSISIQDASVSAVSCESWKIKAAEAFRGCGWQASSWRASAAVEKAQRDNCTKEETQQEAYHDATAKPAACIFQQFQFQHGHRSPFLRSM